MSPRPDDLDFEIEEPTPTRKAIAERVSQANREIPVFLMHTVADATRLVAGRDEMKAAAKAQVGDTPPRVPTYNDMLIAVVAKALSNHPRFNAWYSDDEGLKLVKQINVGFAVATETGVMMPTVADADKKGLDEIAAETAEMVDLARKGRLRASLQMGSTFSISNVGPMDVSAFNAIISPPQTGILAVGSLMERALVIDGGIQPRPTLHLTLTVDHRAADGLDGALFLRDIKDGIETWG
jgi:pyruvate dehydrogenase E2 component (dihydrolipoamide acetyltransferase)